LLHKSGNEFKCLISDFGEVQAENIVRKSTGATGTISYCAPEVLRKDASGRYANFTTKSDIFSLGMILYFMCFGRLPYTSAENIQEEFEDLDVLRAEISTWSGFKDERRERPELPDQLYEFLKRLLAIDPLERPSAEEILHAIRTERNLESPPPRVGRSNSSNGNIPFGIGKRIQALDTPTPGTPEPRDKSTAPVAFSEDEKSETNEEDNGSPLKKMSSIRLTPRDSSESFLTRRDRSQTPPTPLLMPPPTTSFAHFKNQLVVYRHHASTWAMLNRQSLFLAARVVSFIIKFYALTKPCLPMAPGPLIAYPLLVFAALDLGIGRVSAWRFSILSLLAHFAILIVVSRWNGLCTGGTQHWDWES
jgi:serine/threonine protein kinase